MTYKATQKVKNTSIFYRDLMQFQFPELITLVSTSDPHLKKIHWTKILMINVGLRMKYATEINYSSTFDQC
jgi:hypothetical protein